MGKLIGLDIGSKRVGVAETDELQLIATPLETVAWHELLPYLQEKTAREAIDKFIVGQTTNLKGQATDGSHFVHEFLQRARKRFPQIEIVLVDERFTSKIAQQALIDGGMKKSKRKNKGNVDLVSACLILQSYL